MKTQNNEYHFETVEGKPIDDVVDYILDKLIHEPGGELFVGVDSKVKNGKTQFEIVIAIRYPGKGAHVIHETRMGRKHTKDTITDRLWEEIGYAVDVALHLRDRISHTVTVHIDISPNKRDKSHALFGAATGWLKGTGLPFATKPDAWVAMRPADALTRANRYKREDA